MNETPLILGFDIGGTKTAVVLGTLAGAALDRVEVQTWANEPFEVALPSILAAADNLLESGRTQGLPAPDAISVAVGGPLDIEQGIIYSPPHLPNWKAAPLKKRLQDHFNLPVFVEHDGNAGALAEAYFGAGRGVRNLVYLTAGTGLGAGIIINGQIYRGSSDAAGEIGHIRISDQGVEEYGKIGSWESFCSGAGLVKLARLRAPNIWPADTTTHQIVQRALADDPQARALIEEMGTWLGKGIAILVDILNPQVVIVGTLGVVLGDLLLEPARIVVQKEALEMTARACRIVPAQLGSELSSVAALMAAIDAHHSGRFVSSSHPYQQQILDSLSAGLDVRRRTIEVLSPLVAATAQIILQTLQGGGKVLTCGNGGSAASAQHLVGELVGRYKANRAPLPAVALTADSSVITCIGNDYGYDEVFSRSVLALARRGDLLIGFTTSGRSPNVLAAFRAARTLGVKTIALTGEAGLADPVADFVLAIPSKITARVQEEHDAVLHAWCEVIDDVFVQ